MGITYDVNQRGRGETGPMNHHVSDPNEAARSRSEQAPDPEIVDAEIEEQGGAALEPVRPPPPARLTHHPSSGGLVYEPIVRQVSHTEFQVCGRREVSGTIPWGFWGGVLLAFVAYFLITGTQGFWSIMDIAWAMVALTVGLVLFRFGKRSSRRLDVLCALDFEREMIVWPAATESASGVSQGSLGSGELVLNFEEIEEVVFAMIDYPLSQRKNDVDVHAFTLLVRDGEQRLIPIIEATPAKGAAHEIAKMIAGQLRLNISYVGNGF